MPHTVPSVNPTEKPIEDNEADSSAWIDPLFTSEEGLPPLSDDPDNLTEVPDDKMPSIKGEETVKKEQQAADDESETEEAGVDKSPAFTAEELDQVLSDDELLDVGGPDPDDDGEEQSAEEAAAEEAKAQPPRQRRNNRERRERRARERTAKQLQQLQTENAEQSAQIRLLTDIIKPGEQPAARVAEPEPEPAPKEQPIPTLAEFDYEEAKYEAAMAAWTKNQVAVHMHERETKQIAKAEQEQLQQQTEQDAQEHQEHMEGVLKKFRSREETLRTTVDDYDDVVYDPKRQIPTPSAQVAWDSEVGPELAYYIATHQDEVKAWPKDARAIVTNTMRIEARLLNDKQAAAAKAEEVIPNDPVGVVEAEEAGAGEAIAAAQAATTGAAPPRSAKRRTKTNAPPPPPRVKGTGSSDDPDLSSMSMDEYRRARGFGPTP